MEGVGGGTEAEAGDRWQVGGEVEGGHGHLLRRRSLAPKKMLCSHIPTLSVCPGRKEGRRFRIKIRAPSGEAAAGVPARSVCNAFLALLVFCS